MVAIPALTGTNTRADKKEAASPQALRATTGKSMGKLVVSLDGVVIKEVQITKDKTTLGRRPYNDIVIDNLAVSGEHAVLQMVGADVFIEDLNSTNGTYINGKAIKKQLLAHNDTVEIGKYKIKYLVDESGEYEKTMIMRTVPMDTSQMRALKIKSGIAQAGMSMRVVRDRGAGWTGTDCAGLTMITIESTFARYARSRYNSRVHS